MNIVKKMSIPDQVDNHKRLMAFAMLLLSMIYGIKTILYFVDKETSSYLVLLAKVLAFLLFIVILVLITWRIVLIKNNKKSCLPFHGGFIMQMRDRALVISWILTFVFLSLVTMTTQKDSSPLPAEFYLNFTAFFMLAVFGVSFFILSRTKDDEEFE